MSVDPEIHLCIDPAPTHCMPCDSDADCQVDFSPVQPRCLPLGEAGTGTYCLARCSERGDLPPCRPGSICTLPTDAGARDAVCLPDSGICSCSAWAVSVEAGTDCHLASAAGTCPGRRTCTSTGVPECSGTQATSEVCNGADDDCDGDTDESFQDVDQDGTADCVDCDIDADGVTNANPGCPACVVCDNCLGTPNPDQVDLNDNGVGDACEDDWDGDGIANEVDVCPWVGDSSQADLDKDGAGDACDDDDDGDSDPDASDCAPLNPEVHAGANETCNGMDDDCDGSPDEGAAIGCTQYFLDTDGDGFGQAGSPDCLCAPVADWKATAAGDCDDGNAGVHPGTVETCNGVDDDCDGDKDEAGATGCRVLFRDEDLDGWGAIESNLCLCAPGGTWTAWAGGDCNDAASDVFPGSANACVTAAACCAPADACLSSTCARSGGPCESDGQCPSDYHCQAGTCIPWLQGSNPTCSRTFAPGIFRPALQCRWSGPPATDPYPDSTNVIPTPMVADFDFDDNPDTLRPSIVFTSNVGTACDDPNDYRNGRIRVIDGATCEHLFTLSDYEVVAASPVAIGDIDRAPDGRPEIVANAAGGGLVAFKFDAAQGRFVLLWHSREADGAESIWGGTNYRWAGPTLADVDGDGSPEVAMDAILHDSTGRVIASNLGWKGLSKIGQIPVLLDVDGDAKAEMITGDGAWALVPGTGWVKEAYFTSTVQNGFVAVADFGPHAVEGLGMEGLPEVIVIGWGTARIQTLSGATVFGPFDIPFFPPAPNKGFGGAPTVGDFDGDGRPEFAIASSGAFSVFDPDCDADPLPAGCFARGILWAQPNQDFSSSTTGSSVFDFEGDGLAEAVYGDECFFRVYSGRTGEVLFSQSRSSGTWNESPIVADVDGDFRAEIIGGSNRNCSNVTCGAIDPFFRGRRCALDEDCPSGAAGACIEGYCRCETDEDCESDGGFVCTEPLADTPGTGKVCRAGHSGIQGGVAVFRDIGDNWVGSRAIWNQTSYCVTNVNDDGSIPPSGGTPNWLVPRLNNFRQNVQGNLHPALAPDLTASLGVLGNCDGEGALVVTGAVCNRGAAPVAHGIPIEFTSGDTVACALVTTGDLLPGECESLACTYHPGTGQLTIGLDVDPGMDGGSATECREDNNTTGLSNVTCTNL